MPRPPREDYAGAVWHLVARGVRKSPIFLDARDYEVFLELLAATVKEYGWICHAYCLMPNHYHLLVETPEPTLSKGMERLNGRYAAYFNSRHDVEGHVFERRFRSIAVHGEGHLYVLSSYIALNPVRAGLCAHPALWLWSSFRAAIGLVRKPKFLSLDWLGGLFGDERSAVEDAYERFVCGSLVPTASARASP